MNIPTNFIKRPFREGMETLQVIGRRLPATKKLVNNDGPFNKAVFLVDDQADFKETVLVCDMTDEFCYLNPKFIFDLNTVLSPDDPKPIIMKETNPECSSSPCCESEATKNKIELEIIAVKTLRLQLDDKIQAVRALQASRERSLAITKLQEAVMWLGMDLKRINESNPGTSPNPYPNSKNPSNTTIDATDGGMKL